MNYPDLSSAKMIAFDTETYDPYLIEEGPGCFRRDGYVMGVSLATDDGFAEYYSLHHSDTPSDERSANLKYIKTILGNNISKLGVNCGYDFGWLHDYLGVEINGKLNDIQIAEPLLDEYQQHYSLDFQSHKYLGVGKENDELKEWCEKRNLKGDPRKYIWQMPYELVRKYAIGDVKQPLVIFEKQKVLLEEQNLMRVYDMETDLLRPIFAMRSKGIRVDRNKIRATVERLEKDIITWERELFDQYGEFNVNSSQQIAEVLAKLHIKYPLTNKGSPNIDHKFLEFNCGDSIGNKILKLRSAKKVISTFLMGAFTDYNVQDRIHPNFVTMKQDEGGTVTGRLSCQNPNLQQVPSKDETYGPECRSVFIPEENCWYGKIDYSQIEYRIIAHYALGAGSDKIRKEFNDNPYTDYHYLVQQWIQEVTGVSLERKKVKNLNFGTAYFMGIESMSKKFGWSMEQSEELNKVYFDTFTFLKPTRTAVVNIAKMRGYVHTILGRRARITHAMRENRKEYIVWNHLVQGTAADIMKKAIVDAWKSGVLDVLTAHITVHDELGVSVPKTKEGIEAYRELKNTMEHVVNLKIPIIAEAEIGSSWGETKKFDFDELKETI